MDKERLLTIKKWMQNYIDEVKANDDIVKYYDEIYETVEDYKLVIELINEKISE